jgi:hypothetical protein
MKFVDINKADKQNWTKQELEDYERASIKERDEIGRLDVAKTMKLEGYPTEIICKLTKLKKEEVEKL